MRLTIVRHAHAGAKGRWTGPDLERPLDQLGERQTAALTQLLAMHPVHRIVASPALRCLQTVASLEARSEVTAEVWDDLGPDGHASRIVTALFGDQLFHHGVVCTHGELLRPLLHLEDLRRLARKQRLGTDRLLTKGTAWRLDIGTDGRITKLVHVAPLLR